MENPTVNINNIAELNSVIEKAGKETLLIIDFWAPWCQPCKSLGPVLEAAVKKHVPKVQLVKIDIDQNKSLAAQFKIQSIPAVKFVLDGKIVADFVGAQPASIIEQYISKLLPEAVEEQNKLKLAEDELKAGNYKKAEEIFSEVLLNDPESSEAHLGLTKCYFVNKDVEKAREHFEKINDPKFLKEKEDLENLIFILEECEKSSGKDITAKKAMENPADLEANFKWACCLATDGDYTAAFEALLTIISRDRKFRKDSPRKILISLFNLLGDKNPLVTEYRQRLAKTLYI
ncbi:MAG: hypothetical protein DRI44_00155 [Chlamydiae bacterium]|nr:MAG: hypothetical protein DRI44_00155 [Chlamydiota bacterium]